MPFVYVIVAVPAETPVTRPALFTFATPVLLEPHEEPAVGADPVNWVEPDTHTLRVPLIVGNAFTVIVAV